MNYTEKKSLYESIMNDVARIVKRRIVEAASAADKKIVVFTGKSKYFAGDKVEKFIEKHTDFKTSHTVNDKTYMIVTGEKPGPKKIDYAAKNGIIVMSEDKFFAKYNLTDELPHLNEMHKLRNEEHREILNRIMEIIPPGYKEPIFKNMKRRIRQFCASRNWDEDRIRKEIANDTWFYSSYFFDE